jgi:uncharacterized membrane protein YjgN (DUF898 family)
MSNKTSKFLIISLLSVFSFALISNTVFASITEEAAKKLKTGTTSFETIYGKTTQTPAGIIAGLIQYALSFLGVIFIVLMIYAGFLWMTAMGDSSKIDSSKEIFQSALIGLIIILSSYTLTYFIIKNVLTATTGEPVY